MYRVRSNKLIEAFDFPGSKWQNDNNIKDINGNDVDTKYVLDTIDEEHMKHILTLFPYQDPMGQNCNKAIIALRKLLYAQTTYGVRHCDTIEYSDYWRIQIQFNVAFFPETILWIISKRTDIISFSYGGDECIVATFCVEKI